MSTKLVIFDVDGCLYKHTPGWQEACLHAEAMVGVDQLGLDYEEAKQLGLASFQRHGKISQEWIERGVPHKVAHHAYHAHMDISVVEEDPALREALLPLAESKDVVLATYSHGNRTWMYQALTRLGIQNLFEPALALALENVRFKHKHNESYGFREIAERASRYGGGSYIPFNQAAMVEDTAHNLSIPAHLGMRTHLVATPERVADVPDYVHERHDDIHGALDSIKGWALG